MLERPDNRVKYQLELCRRYVEERLEAVRIDRLQQLIETEAMLRKIFEILVNHVQRALEDSIEYFWYFIRDMLAEFVHYCCHRAQYFGLTCRWYLTPLEEKNE